MKVRIDIDIPKGMRLTSTMMRAGIDAGSLYLSGRIRQSFKPGTGRWYKRPGRWHRASVPGATPAVDYGNLKNAIEHDVREHRDTIVGQIGTNVRARGFIMGYERKLEFGSSRTQARPFMRRTAYEEVEAMRSVIGNAARRTGRTLK